MSTGKDSATEVNFLPRESHLCFYVHSIRTNPSVTLDMETRLSFFRKRNGKVFKTLLIVCQIIRSIISLSNNIDAFQSSNHFTSFHMRRFKMSTEYTRAVIDNGPIKLMDDVRVNSPLRVLVHLPRYRYSTFSPIQISTIFCFPNFFFSKFSIPL